MAAGWWGPSCVVLEMYWGRHVYLNTPPRTWLAEGALASSDCVPLFALHFLLEALGAIVADFLAHHGLRVLERLAVPVQVGRNDFGEDISVQNVEARVVSSMMNTTA